MSSFYSAAFRWAIRLVLLLSLLTALPAQDAATRAEKASQSVALVLGREGESGSGKWWDRQLWSGRTAYCSRLSELRHRESTTMLLADKGSGSFSAPAGAASVARETVKMLTPYRKATTPTKK